MVNHLAPAGAGLGGITRAEVKPGSSVLGNGQAARTETGLVVQITGQVWRGKGVTCVTESQDAPLGFYNSPRGTETTCARPTRSKACSSRLGTAPSSIPVLQRPLESTQDTTWLVVLKLVMTAAETRRRLESGGQLPKVVQGVIFHNGVDIADLPPQSAA